MAERDARGGGNVAAAAGGGGGGADGEDVQVWERGCVVVCVLLFGVGC